ncbi:MAG: type II secretion system protein GspD [Kiritimatiellia bacterium]
MKFTFVAALFIGSSLAGAEEKPVVRTAEAVDPVMAEPDATNGDAPEDPVVTEPVLDAQAVAEAAAAAKAVEEARLVAAAKAAAELEMRTEAKLATRRLSTRIFRLAHANAEEVAERFNATWSGDFGVTWKVLKIAQAFPESNSVMVTAPTMILDACEKVVREIDIDVPQVYIEARFVELSNNAAHKLGIDWQMLDGMKGSLSLDAGFNERRVKGVSTYNSDGSYTLSTADDGHTLKTANLSHINGTLGMSELYILLRALESSEDARTFSNPKIIVSSGKKATVDMTTKYPNVKISAKRTVNGDSNSLDLDMQMAQIPGEDKMMFAQEAFFSWGISLDVTPRLSTNGLINVQIVPTISAQTGWVESGTSSDASAETISARYPVIDVQRLVTEFNMASGTTAVIGGLSRTVETQQDSGIPFLRKIWWIGPRLFGSKIRIKEQKEIIVFVTVGRIDPNRMDSAAGLPKNAVLGRQYVEGVKLEPGDKPQKNMEGVEALDLRPLEVQANDPLATNAVEEVNFVQRYIPFTRDPNHRRHKNGKDE